MKKKIIALILSAALLVSAMVWPASAANVDQFVDVGQDDWFYSHVDYAVSSGLFSGTSDTSFGPGLSMTRGMFVTVLGNKTGIDLTQYTGTRFEDVPASMYYASRINWATENGIVNGSGNGKFSPDTAITREQVATILYNYAKRTGNDTSYRDTVYNGFHDKGKVSSYAVQAMKWATYHKIVNGSGGLLDPQGNASRAQVAAIFHNAETILIKTEILPTEKPSPTPAPTATPTPTATPKPTIKPTATPKPVTSTVYWTRSGKAYHRRTCSTIKDSERLISGTVAEAIQSGHSACKVCKP